MGKRLSILTFVLPGFLLYGIFFLVPTVSSLALSMTNWGATSKHIVFVGLKNFIEMIGSDTIFRSAVVDSLEFSITVVVFQTALALAFALLLVRNTRLNIMYRSIYFFPTIIASVSVAFIWQYMFDPTVGWVNHFLNIIGLSNLTQNWLGGQHIAIFSLAFIQFWMHTGQVMLLYIVGLQAIPRDLYEVGEIEGAGPWQRFRHITWPLLAPSAIIAVVYTTIQSFKVFDLVIATTNGGPGDATEVFPVYIYQEAFTNYQYGYAEAGAVLFLIMMILVTVIQFLIIGRRDVSV
ncbi:carbohydrate ABC transporter permease [Alicyclobacillus sp. SO9]|uniref:carbohydrate ABC transporter permease n=1 Tax=Alicyclobacillus sp. SO9 TaxID=2665646 RepID=UPI0018E8E158|nr:sugar ABC transporter permease [Alicyclobacillus sp. SO9]QQE80477.1 sugar ABC transporter permease [Alicyclobacillus sp. SO9]